MKTKIYYFSRTGNLEKFAEKIRKKGFKDIYNITPGIKVNEKYILIVSTINLGQIPDEYKNFLKDNWKNIIGVAGNGNKNFGSNFAMAAEKVSKKFNVPLILKFELSGNTHDVEKFIKGVEELENGN